MKPKRSLQTSVKRMLDSNSDPYEEIVDMRFPFGDDENILELDSGDGSKTLWL